MKSRSTGNQRRGSHAPRHHLTELNVRTASTRRLRTSRAAGLLMKACIVLIVLATAAVAVRLFSQKFFFRNPEYDLKHLETNLHGLMTDDELGELTGIRPGKNILLLDLAEANRRLASLPEVRSANIERRLPDTVEVGIERRLPVFLLATGGDVPADGSAPESFVSGKSLLCDKEGVVMQPRKLSGEYLRLPVLTGLDSASLKPGQRIDDGRFRDALAVTDALSDLPEESFRVVAADVSKSYAVVVTDGSGARFTFGAKDLPGQIDRLRKLLAHCEESGRRIATANLMVQRNTPVTFILTPEDRSSRIAPVTPSSRKSAKHQGSTPPP